MFRTDDLTSVKEFVDTILQLAESWTGTLPYPTAWYRGVKSHDFELLPGAYFRHDCDETTLTLFFRNLVPSLLHREPTDEWEWYYAMQHYGIPTRLLDWTESPLAALYFALEEDAPGKKPTVWMMDPIALNKQSNWEFIICPYTGTDMDMWLTDNCGRHATVYTFPAGARFPDNSKPLAIYPKRFNPRIIAQRGVFTVHGMDEIPINSMSLKDSSRTQDRLIKITFDETKRDYLRRELYLLGMDKTSIYPEPQSVADDLKRRFGIS